MVVRAGDGIGEDVLARLRQAEEEAARLRKELAAAQAAQVGRGVCRSVPAHAKLPVRDLCHVAVVQAGVATSCDGLSKLVRLYPTAGSGRPHRCEA